MKVLERAKLIRRSKTAQWRPCYLVAEPLKEASDWMEQYRKFWEESFDRIDAYLKVLQAQEKEPAKKDKKRGRKTK